MKLNNCRDGWRRWPPPAQFGTAVHIQRKIMECPHVLFRENYDWSSSLGTIVVPPFCLYYFSTFFFQLIRPHVIIIIQIPKASSVWTCHCGFRWWAVGPAGLVSFYGLCIMTDKKPIYLMQIGYFYSNSIWLTGSAWFPPPLGNSVCRVCLLWL